MFIKDPKTKQPSVTLTLLIIGFAIAAAKMFLSGFTIGTFQMSPFGGTDFMAVVSALGGLYLGRRHLPNDKDDHDKPAN